MQFFHLPAVRIFLPAVFALLSLSPAALGQRSLIRQKIENSRRVRMTGHVDPRVALGQDLGVVDSSEVLPSVTLTLRPSAEQQTALEQFLSEQQDPSSPNYHRWLTPEEFADRFGASSEDIDKVKQWLESQGLNVTGVARARNWISFSGTVAQVGNAFQTEFHRLDVNGRTHFANTVEPSIPVALETAVRGIHGLSDFRLKPRNVQKRLTGAEPAYTSSSGNHYMSPEDLATVYNIAPLYKAGYNGSGQKVVIAGQTQVDLADLQQFRTTFQLSASDPDTILVPRTKDPGIISDDLGEADLDLEWISAVAPGASVIYVYSSDVMDAVQYAIDQNLAPVISVSYGLCEPLTPQPDAMTMQAWARQANAQGITWVNASGDSGGADCFSGSSTRNAGFSVDIPASIPEVTGVGGTQFNEGTGQYWNATNSASGGSALLYIPEIVWNDHTDSDPGASGGGASKFFTKPSWQTGSGVPNDAARDVPDVSFTSSAEHVGYLVYNEGKRVVFGGTSAATPVMAGITVLLNQYLVANGAQSLSGVGNINPKLYSLAQTTPSAFHDITSGDNIVNITCSGRRQNNNCTAGSFGYGAAGGYDQATGLGSLDAFAFVTAWRGQATSVSKGASSLKLTSAATTLVPADSVTLTATVSATNGGTPTGSVAFSNGSASLGTAGLIASGSGSATATLKVAGSQLVSGTNSVTAVYSGDSSYDVSTGSLTVTLTAGGATGNMSLTSAANGASYRQAFAQGMLASVFGSNLAPLTLSASTLPLPTSLGGVSATVNGVSAPLYYVSPTQINFQIPYGINSSNATLAITSNGRTSAMTLPMSAVAPGIFTDGNGGLIPVRTAARGRTVTMYVTGQGAVYPTIPSGSAPAAGSNVANLPSPLGSTRVTIGGVTGAVQFAGIPVGLVGVMQVNFVVPFNAPLGTQPVVVSIGGSASPPVNLTVTAQ